MHDPLAFRRHHIGRSLARAFWLFEAQFTAAIRIRGFDDYRPSDADVLRCLPADGGARIVELAQRARMTRQGMGKLVAGLEARGYLIRSDDPDDARAQRVALSARGRALLVEAGHVIATLEAQWADVLGAQRLETLKQDLFSVSDTLGSDDYL